jgi:thiamine pyrophosphate-dependent acetolactate synthase large subunit-like protein
MKVADYFVSFLSAAGIRHIFGYPGSPLIPLLEAIRRQSSVEWILMRHENSAALAASAQAKMTARPGMCVSTSGPGVLNFVCGIADAHLDRAPLIAITGLVSTASQRHSEFQDIDQTSLFSTLLSHSASCVHPDQLPPLLRNFFGHAEQHQVAVHLALPFDILDTDVDADDPHFRLDRARLPARLYLMPPPEAAMDLVARELEKFDQTVIVLGRGARGCGRDIEALATKLGAPIITTLDGKGIVDESHPNCLGVLGIFGFPAVETTQRMLTNADAVLVFGVDTLKPFLTGLRDIQERSLIQCESDFSSLTQEYHRDRTLVGPLDAIARGLRDRVQPRPESPLIRALVEERRARMQTALDRLAAERDRRYAHPLDFLLRLNAFLERSEKYVVIFDTGAHTLWAAQYLKLTQRQKIVVSNRLGVMGFSLPAAIAAQLTYPDHRAVAICGDGGFAMVMGELATAVQYRLPIILIIFNNGVLQNVLAQQTAPYGTVLHNPDFISLARAFGAEGAVIDGGTEVEAVIRQALACTDRPFLIDLRCAPDLKVPLSKWEATFAAVNFA